MKFLQYAITLAVFVVNLTYTSLADGSVESSNSVERNLAKIEIFATKQPESTPSGAVGDKTQKNSRITNCTDEIDTFRPHLGSILNYFLRMRTCDILEGSTKRMDKVCSEQKYTYTVYYKIAYLKACKDDTYRKLCQPTAYKVVDPWSRLPDEKDQGHLGKGRNAEIYFDESNDEQMIKKACRSVQIFLDSLSKHEIYTNYSKKFSENLHASKNSDFTFSDVINHKNNTVPVVIFSEWYFPYIPFCQASACSASYEEHSANPMTAYRCVPSDCRAFMIFTIVLDSILAFVTIIANSLVLGVAARTKIMRNIPGYFKISLAIADLMVGFFVLPSCIAVTYILYMAPLPFRYPGERISIGDYIARPLAYFIGFFIVLSFAASVYTMAGASIDRYLAITKPFQYRQGKYLTKRRCAWAFGLIWFISFIVAIFPVFVGEPYSLSAFNLILSSGVISSIVYGVALLIPLLAVWSLNGVMLKKVCADREKRSSIRASSVILSQPQSLKQDHMPGRQPVSLDNSPKSTPSVQHSPAARSPTTEKNGDNDTREEMKKTPVTRNVSTTSTTYQKKEKRSSVPAGEGIIERMKRRRSKKSDVFQHRVSSQSNFSNSAASVEKRLARTLAIMIGAFTIALLPVIVTMIAYVILSADTSPGTNMRLASTLYLASRIILSNSFWNCVIYSIRNSHFRRAMWAIFLFKKSKIDRRLRHSISMTHWKRRSAMESSSGSMHAKQTVSKTSSNASSAISYSNADHRRSTMLWSLTSSSPCPSRKGSSDVLGSDKNELGRSLSLAPEITKAAVPKKRLEKSESLPVSNDIPEIPKVKINLVV